MTRQEKVQRLLNTPGAIQIQALTHRAAVVLVQGNGGIYAVMLAMGGDEGKVLGGTCTCRHGIGHQARILDDPDAQPFYSVAKDEGCYHFAAAVQTVEDPLRALIAAQADEIVAVESVEAEGRRIRLETDEQLGAMETWHRTRPAHPDDRTAGHYEDEGWGPEVPE